MRHDQIALHLHTVREVMAGDLSGTVAAIVEAGRATDVAWYVIEQDEPSDPLADVSASLRYPASLATDPAAIG
jgi:hypothetical protein